MNDKPRLLNAMKDVDNWFKLVMPPRRGRFLRKQYKKLRADVEKKSKMLAVAQNPGGGTISAQ